MSKDEADDTTPNDSEEQDSIKRVILLAEDEMRNIVRTHSDELADFIVTSGGKKDLIHRFDGINTWECKLPIEEFPEKGQYHKLLLESAFNSMNVIFNRICPEIWTVEVGSETAYAEVYANDGLCLLLSKDKEALTEAIDDGKPTCIKTWPEFQKILTNAKKDHLKTVSIILGKGKDDLEYMETYSLATVLMIVSSMMTKN